MGMRAAYSTMKSGKITDMDIQALVDGQMEKSAADKLMEILMRDPALLNRYKVYQKQKSLLKSWWKDN